MKRLLIVVFCLFLGGLALAQVWLAHLRVEMARQRHTIQVTISQEETKMDKLSLEYANLIRPERLRKLAHEQLGMNAPRPNQLIQR